MKLSRLFIVAILLVIALFVYFVFKPSEGFRGLMAGDRCGVDLKGCPNERKCMNGICYSTDKPCLGKNELPLYP
jgi:hypothetical protein